MVLPVDGAGAGSAQSREAAEHFRLTGYAFAMVTGVDEWLHSSRL